MNIDEIEVEEVEFAWWRQRPQDDGDYVNRVTMLRRPPDGDDDDGLTVNIDGNPKWWRLIFFAQPVLQFNSSSRGAQTSLHHCCSSSSHPSSTGSSTTHSSLHNCKLSPSAVHCFKLQFSPSVVSSPLLLLLLLLLLCSDGFTNFFFCFAL